MRRLWRMLGVLGCMGLAVASPVFAALTFPDPDVHYPSISSVDVYNNYLELNDQLYVVNYWMQYSSANLTLMTESIDQTFTGRVLESGAEQGNVAPYPYYASGYHKGVFAIYFPAAIAPTWGSANISVQLNGNPIITWTGGPNPPTVSTASLSWHSTATVAATSLLLGAGVIQWATNLSNAWAVALTTQTAGGVKLSSYGDQYFSNAIPSLRSACPQIYTAGVVVLQPTTFLDTPPPSPTASVWPWDLGGSNVRGAIFALFLIGAIYFIGMKAGRMDLGMFACIVLVPIGIRLGMIDVTIGILIAITCALVLGFTLILQRGAV